MDENVIAFPQERVRRGRLRATDDRAYDSYVPPQVIDLHEEAWVKANWQAIVEAELSA